MMPSKGAWFLRLAPLLGALYGPVPAEAVVPEEFILANLPAVLDVDEEMETDFAHRHGSAELDLDRTGRKDYRVIYYTNGSSGVVRIFRREGEGYRLVWQYPKGDGPMLDSLGATTVDDVDLEGDGRRELHLSGSNGKSEVHYLFRWDGAQGHMVSPKADKYPGGRTVGSAFSGSWVVFVDLNRDGWLDAVVTHGDYEGRAVAEGPTALVDTLYVGGPDGFTRVETRRYTGPEGSGLATVGFVSGFDAGETRPAVWDRAWLSDRGAAEGTMEFRLSNIRSGHALGEVDPDSVRVADRIPPEQVTLKHGADGLPYLEVRYRIGTLWDCAREFWSLDGERGRVCFDLSAAVRDRHLMLTRQECLEVR